MTRNIAYLSIIIILAVLPTETFSQSCNVELAISKGYKVNQVNFDSAFQKYGFDISRLRAKLPLQKGDVITRQKIDKIEKLPDFDIDIKAVTWRSIFSKVIVKSCNESQGDAGYADIYVHFHAVENEVSKPGNAKIIRGKSLGEFFEFINKVSPEPYVSYDGDQEFLVGSEFSTGLKNEVIQRANLNLAGGPSSFIGSTSLSNNYRPKKPLLDNFSINGGYKYSKLPTEDRKLKKGNFFLQTDGRSKSINFDESSNLIFNFGVAIEGGNRQSNLVSNLQPIVVDDSKHRALKFYFGGRLDTKLQKFKGSYGLQLGNSGNGFLVNYAKQIVDLESRSVIPNIEKYPISIDFRFNAGKIDSVNGKIPISERFFGGNNRQYFLPNNSWEIASGPFIRSIPTNQLNQTEESDFIGGDSFYATNLTIGVPIWSKSLVPRDIREDIKFSMNDPVVLDSLKKVSLPVYIVETPGHDTLIKDSGYLTLQKQLGTLVETLEDLADQTFDIDTSKRIENSLDAADEALASVKSWDKDDEKTAIIRELVINGQPVLMNDALDKLDILLNDNDINTSPQKPILLTSKGLLQNSANKMKLAYETFVSSPVGLPLAEKNYDSDINYIKSQIDVITQRTNLFAVGPVLMFDAAKINSKVQNINTGFRYGIGPGIRFEFLGTNLTLGYSFNPNRRLDEGRGAFTFAFDFVEMFQ